MKKIYFLFIAMLLVNFAFGQTLIVGQDFDSETSWAFTADPASYIQDDGSDVWAAVTTLGRSNNGFDMAQNGENFWGIRDLDNPYIETSPDSVPAGLGLTSPYDHTLTFENVNIAGKTDLEVSFYYNAYSLNDGYIKAEFFFDNVSQGEEVVFSDASGTATDGGWVKYTKSIPDGTDSVKMIIHAYNNQDYLALDNVRLETAGAVGPTCTLEVGANTAECDAVTEGVDTYSATVAYTGAGTEAFTVVASSGTVGGDDPTTVADGTITISGVEEGTDLSVTITSALCNEVVNITSPTCAPASTAPELPIIDHFEYAVGSALTENEMWSSNAEVDEITVAEGNLSYSGLEASVGNSITFVGEGSEAELAFIPVTTGKVFTSFIFKVTDMANWTTGGYFAYLGGFDSRLNIIPIGNQFGIGVGKKNSLTSVIWMMNDADTVKFDLNSEILVVMNYDVEAGTSEIWVNPASAELGAEAAPAPNAILPDGNITSIDKFTIRQDSETETPTIVIDEVRVGTTWADVTPVEAIDVAENDWNFSADVFVALEGDIANTINVSGLTLIGAEGTEVTIGPSASTIGDMTYTHRLKLNGSGQFDENNLPTGRVLSFDVLGNTLISVALTSANSSSDRMLNIAAGSPENVVAQLTATGGVKDVQEYTYTGEATTIYVYSDDSGINLYHIKATPITPSKESWNFSDVEFVALEGDIATTINVSGLTLIGAEGTEVTIGPSASTIGDMTYTHRLKLNGSGQFDENNDPAGRILTFDVAGNTEITVALTSANSSSDRLLNIAAGNKDNIIAQLNAKGGEKTMESCYYAGGPAKIFMYSDDSGINLYQIITKSVATGISQIEGDVDLQIFPNPVSNGYFTIKTKANSVKDVRIYNLVGKQVFGKIVEANQQINVSNLKTGMYFISFKEKGKISTAKLIIK